MKKKRPFYKNASPLFFVLFAIVIAMPSMSNAEESAQDGLQRCGLIIDASTRLACYDQLSGRENPGGSKAIVNPDLSQNDLSSVSTTSRFDRRAEPESATVKVIKCITRGGNKKYVFYLEGGQVWRQTSDKRLKFKDCNFEAAIFKDAFGHKMQQAGSEKQFRVKRVR